MKRRINRRFFVGLAASTGTALAMKGRVTAAAAAPTVMIRRSSPPIVISDVSGIRFKNGGTVSCVEKAFSELVKGRDPLEALIEGVTIPELDPEETGIGFGGLPNELGVVQLDACCMHGPRKRAGGVAALEGVRTPCRVAQAVMDQTDHHLLVGEGAQRFARHLGFRIEEDLNTPRSRKLWLEWKRRLDPEHYLDPNRKAEAGYRTSLRMLREGLLDQNSFWGTINCNCLSPRQEICGVTTTSGLAFKIPGRAGDSPILGAGLYVDNDIGAAGSTGRGEANLYNLSSYLIVEGMRAGKHPKDAGLEALRRIQENTVEKRLLNSRGQPAFNVRFFILNIRGEYAGVSMYASGESQYALCTEKGAESPPLEPLLEGDPTD